MSKKLLRIFTFGLLGVSLHSFSASGQEQGEDVLPITRHETIVIQDSTRPTEFVPENKTVALGSTNVNSYIPSAELSSAPIDSSQHPKENQPKVTKKEEPQSNLSFNFLYYIFYKFKASDVFDN